MAAEVEDIEVDKNGEYDEVVLSDKLNLFTNNEQPQEVLDLFDCFFQKCGYDMYGLKLGTKKLTRDNMDSVFFVINTAGGQINITWVNILHINFFILFVTMHYCDNIHDFLDEKRALVGADLKKAFSKNTFNIMIERINWYINLVLPGGTLNLVTLFNALIFQDIGGDGSPEEKSSFKDKLLYIMCLWFSCPLPSEMTEEGKTWIKYRQINNDLEQIFDVEGIMFLHQLKGLGRPIIFQSNSKLYSKGVKDLRNKTNNKLPKTIIGANKAIGGILSNKDAHSICRIIIENFFGLIDVDFNDVIPCEDYGYDLYKGILFMDNFRQICNSKIEGTELNIENFNFLVEEAGGLGAGDDRKFIGPTVALQIDPVGVAPGLSSVYHSLFRQQCFFKNYTNNILRYPIEYWVTDATYNDAGTGDALSNVMEQQRNKGVLRKVAAIQQKQIIQNVGPNYHTKKFILTFGGKTIIDFEYNYNIKERATAIDEKKIDDFYFKINQFCNVDFNVTNGVNERMGSTTLGDEYLGMSKGAGSVGNISSRLMMGGNINDEIQLLLGTYKFMGDFTQLILNKLLEINFSAHRATTAKTYGGQDKYISAIITQDVTATYLGSIFCQNMIGSFMGKEQTPGNNLTGLRMFFPRKYINYISDPDLNTEINGIFGNNTILKAAGLSLFGLTKDESLMLLSDIVNKKEIEINNNAITEQEEYKLADVLIKINKEQPTLSPIKLVERLNELSEIFEQQKKREKEQAAAEGLIQLTHGVQERRIRQKREHEEDPDLQEGRGGGGGSSKKNIKKNIKNIKKSIKKNKIKKKVKNIKKSIKNHKIKKKVKNTKKNYNKRKNKVNKK